MTKRRARQHFANISVIATCALAFGGAYWLAASTQPQVSPPPRVPAQTATNAPVAGLVAAPAKRRVVIVRRSRAS